MSEATARDGDKRQDGAKKPIGTIQDWLWLTGITCMLVSGFVPRHVLAHITLVLLGCALLAAAKYPSYLCPVFVLFGMDLVIDWMHLVPDKFDLLLLLPPIAVGVIGAVRVGRKTSN